MKKYLILTLPLLAACSSSTSHIKRLGPLPEAAQAPAACKIVGVLPDTPASKAGLKNGETIQMVNGTKPADALAVADLIDKSAADVSLEVADATGQVRSLKIPLNKERPRLGASCDLTGWRKNSVSAAGNESITVFSGPFAFTVSGILDKGLAFIRVRLGNHSDHPISVSPSLFSVQEGSGAGLKLLSPEEVIYYMNGKDAVPYIKPPAGTAVAAIPADSPVLVSTTTHKKKDEWTQSDESYVKANAEYLNKESLWPANLEPGKTADGLIYFIQPKSLPLIITALVEGSSMTATFGDPKPSGVKMSADELIRFFEAQKKGTPVRLTLKKGTVFVGKYSSYDSLNEIVWFDTPSGMLLTTSSFGLSKIANAEVLAPEPDKKKPAAESLH